MEIETRVSGIPCIAKVTHFFRQAPHRGSAHTCDSDLDYYGYTECEFDIMYTEGISRSGSVLDLGIEHKILEKKGAWIAYNGQLIGQGREAAKDYLIKNPKVLEELQKTIMEKVQVVGGMTLGVGVAENVTAE